LLLSVFLWLHYISQGSVATQLRCGGIYYNCVIANFPQNVEVKEFLKLVSISLRYGQKFGGTFFTAHRVL